MDNDKAVLRQRLFSEVSRYERTRRLLIGGLQEAISDLNFIRTATNDAQIAALAEAASAVATCYLKQAKGEQ
jgi:hypothetical protein